MSLSWDSFTKTVLQCLLDPDTDVYSDAAALESTLVSCIHDVNLMDDETHDEWRVYVVLHFLRNGITTIWTSPEQVHDS